MPLPRAVQEQAERAEAAHLALLAGNTASATLDHQMTPPVETPPVVEVRPADPVVTPAVVVETVPVVAPGADPWELRYRVLDGKYKAEVPRLAARVRELEAQVSGGAATAVVAPNAPAGEALARVTEQYGDDFAAAVDSIAASRTADLASQVQELKGDTASRARNDFMRDLTQLVPTWQTIDQDVAFSAYLDEFDAQTGRVRREFFSEADRANNAARVASFFATFARGSKPAPVPAVVEITPSVEHLIAPDSSNHAEPVITKRTWTRKESAAFYAAARSQGSNAPYGQYTAAEYQRIDAEINAAIVEGRFAG